VVTGLEGRDKCSLRELPLISGMRPKPCIASLVGEMLTIRRLNKPEERNLNRIFALVLRKDAKNTHHDPILNLVLRVMLIIYIHLKSRNPEKTMMPLCATAGGASKQETYMEESTTARYWAGENKYQQPCTSVARGE
jgi:hypothetical protein